MQQSSMGFEELIEDSPQNMEAKQRSMSGRGDVKRTLMSQNNDSKNPIVPEESTVLEANNENNKEPYQPGSSVTTDNMSPLKSKISRIAALRMKSRHFNQNSSGIDLDNGTPSNLSPDVVVNTADVDQSPIGRSRFNFNDNTSLFSANES